MLVIVGLVVYIIIQENKKQGEDARRWCDGIKKKDKP